MFIKIFSFLHVVIISMLIEISESMKKIKQLIEFSNKTKITTSSRVKRGRSLPPIGFHRTRDLVRNTTGELLPPSGATL